MYCRYGEFVPFNTYLPDGTRGDAVDGAGFTGGVYGTNVNQMSGYTKLTGT